MRILLWQTAYLGDVVLTTPLVLTLKKVFPEAQIGFVGRSFIKDLLKGFDVELIPFDKGFTESFRLLEKIRDYQIAITPHISARTALILFLSHIPIRIGFDRSELRWLYTHTVKHLWSLHEVDRNLRLLFPLGVKEWQVIRKTKLFVSEEEKEAVRFKFSLPEEFILLSPFSNFALKEWHMEGWRKLIRNLQMPAVVVGTSKDTERAQELGARGVINLVGKTNIRELLAVISLSKVVISCDSSPVHMANALDVPAISIYTSTSPKYGFYPLKGYYLTPDVSCSPCSPNPKMCKTGTHACLSGVKAEEVLKRLELLTC